MGRSKARVAGALIALTAGTVQAAATGEAWVALASFCSNFGEVVRDVTVSPDSSTVFATGVSCLRAGTVAYEAATGHRLWSHHTTGPGDDLAAGYAVGLSRDGTTLLVAGTTTKDNVGSAYLTLAYDAATGNVRWSRTYKGPGRTGTAWALAVGANTVYVAGGSDAADHMSEYATVAYDVATGATRWERRYRGGPSGSRAAAIGLAADESAVFVTGEASGDAGYDYGTIAYDAATGAMRWARRYHGPTAGLDEATALAVSATTVVVTGKSSAVPGPPGILHENCICTQPYDIATVAYSATTGATRWIARYNGPDDGTDAGAAVAISGGSVFVTGSSYKTLSAPSDAVSIAYQLANGTERWIHRYEGYPGVSDSDDGGRDVAVSPDGERVIISAAASSLAGIASYDIVTEAYAAGDGQALWTRRYDGDLGFDVPIAIAVSPDGGRAYVGGSSHFDYVTLAYDATAQ